MSSSAENEEEEKSSGKFRTTSRIVIVVFIIAGLFFVGRWLIWRIEHVTTDAAYVKADIANIAPEVPGQIIEIAVKDGEHIKKDQILFRIDPEEMERRVAAAKADLASTLSKQGYFRADLHLAETSIPASVEAAKAALELAQKQHARRTASCEHSQSQYNRFKKLYTKGAVGKARLDEVETAWKEAKADYQAADAQVTFAQAKLTEAQASYAMIQKAEAALREVGDGIKKAEEALKIALLTRSRCNVKAPLEGVIARILAKEGDFVFPGRPVLALYDPASRYVEARIEETKLIHLKPGKTVQLKTDSFSNQVLTGKSRLITPAAAAEFSLIPRDISAGEFTKVVQRVPVKIAIDNLEKHPELVPGLSVEVIVER
jgi:membrane fusion protein (multidrug efflux system)